MFSGVLGRHVGGHRQHVGRSSLPCWAHKPWPPPLHPFFCPVITWCLNDPPNTDRCYPIPKANTHQSMGHQWIASTTSTEFNAQQTCTGYVQHSASRRRSRSLRLMAAMLDSRSPCWTHSHLHAGHPLAAMLVYRSPPCWTTSCHVGPWLPCWGPTAI